MDKTFLTMSSKEISCLNIINRLIRKEINGNEASSKKQNKKPHLTSPHRGGTAKKVLLLRGGVRGG
jgi:hypothetical protein